MNETDQKTKAPNRQQRTQIRGLLRCKQLHTQIYLNVGDLQTTKTVFERKTISDLIQSIHGQKVQQGYRKQRFFDQMHAMKTYCEATGRVGFLLISGSLKEKLKWFKERKIRLNTEAIYGAIASTVVRYGINVIWVPTDEELVKVAWKIAQKVEEGKWGVPRRQQLRDVHPDKRVALIANVLRVSPKIADRLFKQFGGLGKLIRVIEEQPNKLLIIDGVGPKTIERVRKLLGFA